MAQTASPSPLDAHTRADLDAAVGALDAEGWLALPVGAKAEHLRALLRRTAEVAPAQVRAACAAKGITPGSPAEAEEWLGGIVPQVRTMRGLATSLEAIRDTGRVRIPAGEISDVAGGRIAVRVLPTSWHDRVLYRGFRADVWQQPGITRENLGEHTGGCHTKRTTRPDRTLVLGAGNVAAIAPLDVVHALFVAGRAVVLKLNPVNDYLAPFLERTFAGLVEARALRIVRGGSDVGAYLCEHAGIAAIHVTGSRATHDAIVWGHGDEAVARRARGEPRTAGAVAKDVTSELGNVGPVIVVPGRWHAADLRFHAENVATQMTQNGGFNCNAAKVLVTWAGWPQRKAFLDALRDVLRRLPPRRAYYPGAADRWTRFTAGHAGAEILGARDGDNLPPALLLGQDATDRDRPCFREESFCAVMAETALDAEGPTEFVGRAVRFANDTLEGTLNACLLVDPRTRRALAGAIDEAVADLRYGTVAINHWPALGFALGGTTWGAYPGSTLADAGSGIGWVHGSRLLDRAEKTVIDGPFRVRPKPAWFVTNPRALEIARRLVAHETDPTMRTTFAVAAAAV